MDRTNLVDTTLHTVSHTLFEGMVLVVLVLILFLGSWRGALLVALTIPLSLLIAFILMQLTDIPAGSYRLWYPGRRGYRNDGNNSEEARTAS